MTRKRKSPVAKTLVRNACAAMLAAIEIHNKPVFEYRYEVTTLLVINAWELLLKALIYRKWKDVTLLEEDGQSKSFEKCINTVASHLSGEDHKGFLPIKESLKQLYHYRNKVAHFHSEELDALLYSLLRANVTFFVAFAKKYFPKDFRMTTSILLPLNLSGDFNPVEFLIKQPTASSASLEVRDFINGLVQSCQRLQDAGIEESIFSIWSVELLSAKKAANTDILAARANVQSNATPVEIVNRLGDSRVSNSPTAPEVRLSEEDLSKVYSETYKNVREKARDMFSDFMCNDKFNKIMEIIKSNPSLCWMRYLNPKKTGSTKQAFYHPDIYNELAEHYKPKPNVKLN